jgi:hypothetical protein
VPLPRNGPRTGSPLSRASTSELVCVHKGSRRWRLLHMKAVVKGDRSRTNMGSSTRIAVPCHRNKVWWFRPTPTASTRFA